MFSHQPYFWKLLTKLHYAYTQKSEMCCCRTRRIKEISFRPGEWKLVLQFDYNSQGAWLGQVKASYGKHKTKNYLKIGWM